MSGFYDRHILPWALNCICGMKLVTHQRQKIVPQARGRVLEVGIGSGLNLPLYDPGKVAQVIGLDPGAELIAMARRRAWTAAVPVEFLQQRGEAIPLESGSIDTAVATYTLCTIPGVEQALAEMRRVLKPGGRLLFCEHGLAPDPSVQRWQARITPAWMWLGGGCHLNRDIPALLQRSGFRPQSIETGYMPHVPRLVGFHYIGSAVPA